VLAGLLERISPKRIFWCAAALLAIPALVAEFRAPLNADAAWLAYAADSVLRGRKLYTDILEINPPLIVWLNLPAALVHRMTGMSGPLAFRAFVLLLLGGSILACLHLGRWLRGPAATLRARLITLSLVFVFGPLVGGIFGQREHLALALIVPFVFLVVLRVQHYPVAKSQALAIGIAAALGFSLKPHFLAVWLLLLGYRTWHLRKEPPRLLVEDGAVMATGMLYILAVLTFTPRYFGFAQGTARDYLVFGQHGLKDILLGDTPAIWLYVAVLSWWILGVPGREGGVGGPLVMVGLGFVIAVALQHKGWSYHYYPVTACAFLLGIGTLSSAVGSMTSRRAWQRVASRAALGVYGVLLGLFVTKTLIDTVRRAAGELSERQVTQLDLRAAVNRLHGARSILILSSQLRDAFPLVNDTDLEWNGSSPVLWVPLVRYRSYAGPSEHTAYRSPDQMDPVEQLAFRRVVSDFTLRPPDVLVVESRPLNERRTHFPGGFDYCSYFGQDPRFASLLREYLPVEDVRGLLVFRRANSEQFSRPQDGE
jgi:hypothetical protein